VVAAAAASLALGGCAGIRAQEARETEQMLAAAGFRMKPADTPDRAAHLETLPARKLVPYKQGDQIYYVYADPDVCQCLWTGDEQAYQAYQKTRLDKEIADTRLAAARYERDAAMNWNLWGPWPWR
jgi:hypothetical protein